MQRLHGSGSGSRTRDALLAAWAAQLAESAATGGGLAPPPAIPVPETLAETTPEVLPEAATRTRQDDTFATLEQAELEGDAARLFRGRFQPARPSTPGDGAQLVGLRAAEARGPNRRVTAKTGTRGGHLGGRGRDVARLDGQRRPELMRDMPHAGRFVRPSASARLLGAQQSTLHRPTGSVVIG